jgi:hypothetical protein
MTASCGRDDCSSPCHAGTGQGRYCAPARCYCGGCPSHVPLPPPPPPWVARLVPCHLCPELTPETRPGGLCAECAALRSARTTAHPNTGPPPDAVPMDRARIRHLAETAARQSQGP